MKLLILVMVLSFFSPLAFAKVKEFGSLQLCLKQVQEGKDNKASECYDLALPWAHSKSIFGKALYLKSLKFYLWGGSDRGSFESIGRKLTEYYQRHLEPVLTPAAVARLQDDEIATLFEALQETHFYAHISISSDVALEKLNTAFAEMELRKIATNNHALQLFRAFLKSNKWTYAQALKVRWKSLANELLPFTIVKDDIAKDDLGYYALSSDLSKLVLNKFDYKNGIKILISGDCHFAEDAFKILSQNKDLSKLIAQQALVIGGTDFRAIDRLRKQYPNFEVHVTHNPSDWFKAGVDTFYMPNFTFFLDGQRTYTFHGVNTNLVSDFCRGLKSIEMKLPPSCTR